MNSKIIAVDFDGTLCENKWPEIGEANEDMIYYLRKRQAEGDKLILWTCRVGDMLRKAINWCYNYGLIFNAVNENLPEIIDSFGSDTRKIFANEYIDDRNRLISSCREKSNMELWIENEVRIACEHERKASGTKEEEQDYGCACFESALKAYRSLLEDGHSGFSIGMTKYILVRMIEGKPLTPIVDTEDVWSDARDRSGHRGEVVNYQLGYFHAWEHYSKPLEASPLIGGAPAGVFSKIFGIVEFSDGVRRVDPTDICFCDEENQMLSEMEKFENE